MSNNKELHKLQIKEWMDNQLEAKKLQSLRPSVAGLELYNYSQSGYVHISPVAVREIAGLFELEIGYIARNDEDYPHEIYFTYEGTRFIALESDEEYQRRGAVV